MRVWSQQPCESWNIRCQIKKVSYISHSTKLYKPFYKNHILVLFMKSWWEGWGNQQQSVGLAFQPRGYNCCHIERLFQLTSRSAASQCHDCSVQLICLGLCQMMIITFHSKSPIISRNRHASYNPWVSRRS